MRGAGILLCAILASLRLARAEDKIVGGSSGWALGVTYSDISATVGDVLVFNYKAGAHDVWGLPTAACVFKSAGAQVLSAAGQSTTRVPLTAPGTFHYGCSVGQHCASGMLVAVSVAQASGQAPSAGPSSNSCSPEIQALIDSAGPDYDGGTIAWATVANYSSGTVSTYMSFFEGEEACSTPKAVGVEISFATLGNLPTPEEVEHQPPKECAGNLGFPCFPPSDTLFLPFFGEEAPGFNPFPVLEFNWNPSGHMPEGTYSTPHFDIHFMLIPTEAILNISAGPCTGLAPDVFTAANQPLPKACFPGSKFANINEVVPLMGNHYVDFSSPEISAELAGEEGLDKWNATWIWGGLGGEIIFFELMAKRSYFMTEPDMCAEIPGMPQAFSIAGFKPHTYCVLTSPTGVRVELRDFTMYEHGCAETDDLAPQSYATLPPGSPPLPPECVLPSASM